MPPINISAAAREFIAMTIFVYVGTGSAATNTFNSAVLGGNDPAWVAIVALQFGLAIACLAYATRGGQINCAVTIGLIAGGALDAVQGAANIAAQLLGSIAGATLLLLTVDAGDADTDGLTQRDFTGLNLGSNAVNPRYNVGNALVGEIIMTGVLMYVVYETAVSKHPGAAGTNAPLAIGLAVFLAHVVLINIDGCSINPSRSFGPAVVASMNGADDVWDDHWVFWVGPIIGAAVVGVGYGRFVIMPENQELDQTAATTSPSTPKLESEDDEDIEEA
mmetsp:Transcript_18577/g.53047  ORF Transcript_18577/g.53047 Transcript_18577/m.53047 type:complete len:277 (+) Transcript_18577:114-944(+)|eukprot:CAMPEP_0119555696 /NCGR_PEP_ID=MMETSP1352-20130426/7826_1 /TAXON_ID=265584 /ORGANISM="Stauroneis constricta, Strain CCMP1120" /LENGTH=276 /DNA_ID=CAMNT_0007602505 /DNA_START=88 /DNA_END=918 /DNA_ORIENTATION=-